MEFSTERIIKLADAHDAIPTRDGKLYAELFCHGTLTVEIYAPKGTDLQQPHTRDELYIVVAGRGWFSVEGQRFQF
ncbi:MAG TPA: cupin domain-containing protein, partial [Candidatus Binatia bacterium]|nr:cupin domain-containing protein [Candidatus Binatia bacterium]